MNINKWIVPILVILSLVCGFCLGMSFGLTGSRQAKAEISNRVWNPPKPSREITVEEGLQFLEMARSTHQYLINHPEKRVDEYVGSVEFQQWCIYRYNEVSDLIVRLQAQQTFGKSHNNQLQTISNQSMPIE